MNEIEKNARHIEQPPPPPLTEEAIVAWLRQQNPDGEYTWQDPVFCLVGNYLRDHGSSWGTVEYSSLPNYELIAKTKPWTFGAALARAEQLKALPAPDVSERPLEGEILPPLVQSEKLAIGHHPK